VQRLKISSGRGEYSVIAEAGTTADLGSLLDRERIDRPRSVVSDSTVGPLWGVPAAASLDAPLIELADGEKSKRWPAVESLLGRWLDCGLHRGDSVAAVGGGVLTDTVGFAAAVYLRGVDWIAVPTTLLAMVDASVGGKTGVNLIEGKNLVGAFWPPKLVVIDVDTLATLPERELRAGMAEVVKTAWIGDHDLLGLVASNLDTLPADRWQELVMRCVAVKAEIVGQDERETGRRAALNLGHTLGHALEAATGYRRFLHGEAVAWGLLAAARLGARRGLRYPPSPTSTPMPSAPTSGATKSATPRVSAGSSPPTMGSCSSSGSRPTKRSRFSGSCRSYKDRPIWRVLWCSRDGCTCRRDACATRTTTGDHSRRGAVAEGLVARHARRGHLVRACAHRPTRNYPGTRNLVVLATRSSSSTVDEPQSAAKAIYHSYLSESRGGPGPTWLSEGGWAGGGGGEKALDGVRAPECSPPARQRRVHRRCLASRFAANRRAWHPLAAALPRGTSTDARTETGRAAVADRGRRARKRVTDDTRLGQNRGTV